MAQSVGQIYFFWAMISGCGFIGLILLLTMTPFGPWLFSRMAGWWRRPARRRRR